MESLIKDFHQEDIKVCFSNVGNRVWRTLQLAGTVELLGEEWFHETCHDAVNHCLAFDDSHIDDELHFGEDTERTGAALTKTKEDSLNIDVFGVHI